MAPGCMSQPVPRLREKGRVMTPINLTYRTGDILATDCAAVVIPVNCRGVMGAGLAKQAAKKWPWVVEEYKSVGLKPGAVLPAIPLGVAMYPGGEVQPSSTGPGVVLLVATKDDWRQPSRLEWVKAGLRMVCSDVATLEVKSIAIPALGCGLGGLNWNDVRPLIEAAAAKMPGVRVDVYPPQGWPWGLINGEPPPIPAEAAAKPRADLPSDPPRYYIGRTHARAGDGKTVSATIWQWPSGEEVLVGFSRKDDFKGRHPREGAPIKVWTWAEGSEDAPVYRLWIELDAERDRPAKAPREVRR